MEKPYVVKYKAKRNPAIKAGIHGRFASEDEARAHVLKAREWFDKDFGKPDAAHVGIVVDQESLARQTREEEGDDGIDETTLESQPIEAVPFLVELMEADHEMTKKDAEQLCTRHARIISKHLKAGPFSLKKMRETVMAIFAADNQAAEGDAEKEEMRAELDRLRAELAKKKGKKKGEEEEEVTP